MRAMVRPASVGRRDTAGDGISAIVAATKRRIDFLVIGGSIWLSPAQPTV
jgi:hypothetical protein